MFHYVDCPLRVLTRENQKGVFEERVPRRENQKGVFEVSPVVTRYPRENQKGVFEVSPVVTTCITIDDRLLLGTASGHIIFDEVCYDWHSVQGENEDVFGVKTKNSSSATKSNSRIIRTDPVKSHILSFKANEGDDRTKSDLICSVSSTVIFLSRVVPNSSQSFAEEHPTLSLRQLMRIGSSEKFCPDPYWSAACAPDLTGSDWEHAAKRVVIYGTQSGRLYYCKRLTLMQQENLVSAENVGSYPAVPRDFLTMEEKSTRQKSVSNTPPIGAICNICWSLDGNILAYYIFGIGVKLLNPVTFQKIGLISFLQQEIPAAPVRTTNIQSPTMVFSMGFSQASVRSANVKLMLSRVLAESTTSAASDAPVDSSAQSASTRAADKGESQKSQSSEVTTSTANSSKSSSYKYFTEFTVYSVGRQNVADQCIFKVFMDSMWRVDGICQNGGFVSDSSMDYVSILIDSKKLAFCSVCEDGKIVLVDDLALRSKKDEKESKKSDFCFVNSQLLMQSNVSSLQRAKGVIVPAEGLFDGEDSLSFLKTVEKDSSVPENPIIDLKFLVVRPAKTTDLMMELADHPVEEVDQKTEDRIKDPANQKTTKVEDSTKTPKNKFEGSDRNTAVDDAVQSGSTLETTARTDTYGERSASKRTEGTTTIEQQAIQSKFASGDPCTLLLHLKQVRLKDFRDGLSAVYNEASSTDLRRCFHFFFEMLRKVFNRSVSEGVPSRSSGRNSVSRWENEILTTVAQMFRMEILDVFSKPHLGKLLLFLVKQQFMISNDEGEVHVVPTKVAVFESLFFQHVDLTSSEEVDISSHDCFLSLRYLLNVFLATGNCGLVRDFLHEILYSPHGAGVPETKFGTAIANHLVVVLRHGMALVAEKKKSYKLQKAERSGEVNWNPQAVAPVTGFSTNEFHTKVVTSRYRMCLLQSLITIYSLLRDPSKAALLTVEFGQLFDVSTRNIFRSLAQCQAHFVMPFVLEHHQILFRLDKIKTAEMVVSFGKQSPGLVERILCSLHYNGDSEAFALLLQYGYVSRPSSNFFSEFELYGLLLRNGYPLKCYHYLHNELQRLRISDLLEPSLVDRVFGAVLNKIGATDEPVAKRIPECALLRGELEFLSKIADDDSTGAFDAVLGTSGDLHYMFTCGVLAAIRQSTKQKVPAIRDKTNETTTGQQVSYGTTPQKAAAATASTEIEAQHIKDEVTDESGKVPSTVVSQAMEIFQRTGRQIASTKRSSCDSELHAMIESFLLQSNLEQLEEYMQYLSYEQVVDLRPRLLAMLSILLSNRISTSTNENSTELSVEKKYSDVTMEDSTIQDEGKVHSILQKLARRDEGDRNSMDIESGTQIRKTAAQLNSVNLALSICGEIESMESEMSCSLQNLLGDLQYDLEQSREHFGVSNKGRIFDPMQLKLAEDADRILL